MSKPSPLIPEWLNLDSPTEGTVEFLTRELGKLTDSNQRVIMTKILDRVKAMVLENHTQMVKNSRS